jgi:hypothetical protein
MSNPTFRNHRLIYAGHTWPQDQQVVVIPWADISRHPSDYYDSERFEIPVKLQAPELLSSPHVWILAEYLTAMDTDEPFVFRQKNDICRRSSVRQAEDEAERTAGDEEDEEATEKNKAAEGVLTPRPTSDTSGDGRSETTTLMDSGSEKLTEKDTSEDHRSEEDRSKDGSDESFVDQAASEHGRIDNEASEDRSDMAGVPVGGKGRGSRGSGMRGRGGAAVASRTTRSAVARCTRSTRSDAVSASIGTSTRGAKRKAEDREKSAA